ncbi:MAG: HAD-IIA family hydrolase [Nocardioidaceae bacterium]
MLKQNDSVLWSAYDLAILDLDGVVYIGRDAVPGAAGHLAEAVAAGMHLAYVTNNASRPPRAVAQHLGELGIPAGESDVVTSAQAAARLLARSLPPGSAVFVIGGTGLYEALEEHGLRGVASSDEQPAAVVSGYAPDLPWARVSEGAILVREGLPWFATNTDHAVPTPRGLGPGNGVLVDAVARFAGREPVVAGKPLTPLFEETQLRVGGNRPLVVGDRLDTDIEGAANAGLDSLLVLTGVTGLDALVAADARHRPTYIAEDLSGLGQAHQAPEAEGEGYCLRGWHGSVSDGRLVVRGAGARADWWRVVAATAWAYQDTSGQCVDPAGLAAPG